MALSQSTRSAYLLTGGNMGDRMANISRAAGMIANSCGRVIRQSSIYETAAWGISAQPAFLNQALRIRVDCSAIDLMEKILAIEEKMGRIRQEKYGPRTIDIDILFYESEIINMRGLVIPHPEIQNRRFALTPLNEIAQDFIHPLLRKSIRQLLDECTDKLDVKKITMNFEE
ncbi:MAG TPA: 2-amino-4-hydroxy-6-hydroxymethyldihydropteridine diphosphokinase [Puia sp.]|nr:2-amino-4-hydroxy-6-hydroxymethyldihydropteridine diphosphokinase [Puia sp.]